MTTEMRLIHVARRCCFRLKSRQVKSFFFSGFRRKECLLNDMTFTDFLFPFCTFLLFSFGECSGYYLNASSKVYIIAYSKIHIVITRIYFYIIHNNIIHYLKRGGNLSLLTFLAQLFICDLTWRLCSLRKWNDVQYF